MKTEDNTWQKLSLEGLSTLIGLLQDEGYDVIAPVRRDEAIIYDQIFSLDDLPAGWVDEQEKGLYRLRPSKSPALFSYVVGAHNWRRFLDPPKRKIWEVERGELNFKSSDPPARPKALLGVRACELAALKIQDRVFIEGPYVDTYYQSERERALVIGVNCQRAAATCFCTSMNTGPQIDKGSDLLLTEFCDATEHFFALRADSDRGRSLLSKLDLQGFEQGIEEKVAQQGKNTSEQMKRHLPTEKLKDLLEQGRESKIWEDVAQRCLSCANCTLVCPTCFCSTVEDVTDLSGEHAERWKKWDSCFNSDFSYISGGSVRSSTASRYRQWLTHKLAGWQDQFGSSGCVGCGRCISWCPVGIDLTEEIQHFEEEIDR